jgi:hypothetical protein
MKLYLKKMPTFGLNSNELSWQDVGGGTNNSSLFTVGKWYEGEIMVTITNPMTLEPDPPSYVIKCDDSNFRRVEGDCFITQEEWREIQLNKLV